MPQVARVGVDSAGGVILGAGGAGYRVAGAVVAVLGDAVAGHGDAPHAAPTMATGQDLYRVNGIAVCRGGDLATCGHPSSGSTDFRVG